MNNSSDSIYELYKDVLVAAGGEPKAADSLHNLIARWLTIIGGTPDYLDSKNDLLRKVARALSVTCYHGDSNIQILQRISGAKTGSSEWDCLRALLPDPPAPTPPMNIPGDSSAPLEQDHTSDPSPI